VLVKPLFTLLLGVTVVSATLVAQQRPLAPQPPNGLRVVPFFEGFYANPDGGATFVFGYSNPNRDDVVEIPIGPDNFIEPKEFNGSQPTSFPPPGAETPDTGAAAGGGAAGGGGAGGAAAGGGGGGRRAGHERGVFTVTVPASFKGDVVWTIRNQGQKFSVPGRTRSGAYQLRWPMAMGSTPPLLWVEANGSKGRGPTGIHASPMKATVGTPIPLTVYLNDDAKREVDPLPVRERGTASKAVMNVTWFKHAGPVDAPITFKPVKQSIPETTGTAATLATFKQPGEYVIRVKADVFGRVDTSAGNQCCWTNGYIKVIVAN
jgi:hypothetical protein